MVSRLRHRGDAVCRHLPPAQPFRTSVLPRRLACRISPLDKPIYCMNYLFYEEFTRSPNRGGPLLPPARLPRPPPERGSPRLFRRRISSQQAAERFGYSHGSFRVLCHHFRRSQPDFFRDLKPGPRSQPKKDAVRQLILVMRKQNLSVYDIERSLKDNGTPLSVTAIWEILHEEGFARLPRRQDEERPDSLRPSAAAVADRREFSLLPRTTQFGGRFLFLPFLARCGFPELVKKAGYPGTKMIP